MRPWVMASLVTEVRASSDKSIKERMGEEECSIVWRGKEVIREGRKGDAFKARDDGEVAQSFLEHEFVIREEGPRLGRESGIVSHPEYRLLIESDRRFIRSIVSDTTNHQH
ncbi:uncharacterized protein EI90DRAFT_3021628 [Cantharellus anzutake]|uniref:uncharacterized protein n=1 Tax=Cantharellus anzutake TaxID=1750568 RepID=UPI001906A3E1|nr:uncharacterized protein EI90DRAFT_3021628 [Cantharellus anzutake]KAF8316245.1 hypothetical protein EI90DRAFT_3021628 [Cantharellus anzutake]